MTEEVPEAVDDAATEIPEDTVTETHEETHDSEEHGSGNNELLSAIEAIPSKVADILNAAKEESPVTPAEEETLDETPLRKPWTHRSLFRRG